METFSTKRSAWLPQATNVVTLAVLVAATAWSGAQRPASRATLAAGPAAAATTAAVAQQQQQPDSAARASESAAWPTQANVLPRDGLQAVGYQPRATR